MDSPGKSKKLLGENDISELICPDAGTNVTLSGSPPVFVIVIFLVSILVWLTYSNSLSMLALSMYILLVIFKTKLLFVKFWSVQLHVRLILNELFPINSGVQVKKNKLWKF